MAQASRNEDGVNEVFLGTPGLKYVRDSLASGKELADALLHVVDFEAGGVVAIVPRSVTVEGATDLYAGGKLRTGPTSGEGISWQSHARVEPIPNLYAALAQRVRRHLESGLTAIGVFEDAMAMPHDPWIQNAALRMLITRAGVYYLLVPGDTDDAVERTLKRASSIRPPLIGVLARCSGLRTGAVGRDDLLQIASTAEAVVVGAYDGEAFVVWSPAVQRSC